ncbi:restriction endonuclease subunit S [Clostridium sp. JNZ J1-5]
MEVNISNEVSLRKLSEVVSIDGGYAFKSDEFVQNKTPIIRIGNIMNGNIEIDYNIGYDIKNRNFEKYLIKNQDILIAMSGATIGKLGIYKSNTDALLNQRVGKFKVIDERILDNNYLYYYLGCDSVQNKIKVMASGCAQPNISPKQLLSIHIPIPPLEIQKKIVEVLEKAEKALEKRKEANRLLDELVKSRFIEMFGDLKSNSKNWDVLEFDEFAKIDANMTKDFEEYKDYPHIGIECIEKNTGRILEYKLVKDSDLKSGKYVFDNRHIIYSKIRPNLNKVALPSFTGVCSADSYPILCNEKITTRSYLGYVLRSEFFLSYILAFSGRTNIPKVNKEQLRGFKMPTPPIELQNEFADFVKQIDKLKFEMQNSLEEMENNFNSLMQRAFKGELFN